MKLNLTWMAFAAMLLAGGSRGWAGADDGCLNCHQYRGLAKIGDDGKTISHYYVDPNYFKLGLGPHARLRCTDCHVAGEVEVFPHQKTTPVDCTKACHLESPGKLERQFSHENVGRMLAGSIHGRDVLEDSNRLLGSPLKQGQSNCLLCHDEPMFARKDSLAIRQEARISRCDTCHKDQLPQDTQFSYWHVHARTQPARSHQDVVKVCGLCHTDQKVREKYNLPDAVASYLFSFHGKAVLLGSTEAAGCLDCHAGESRNVHLMLASREPTSTTHQDQLADTCRTPSCHPTAGARISSAAIHLNLPTSRGVEFVIACIFVLLIVFTFGPSLMLMVLKMLQIVVGRKEDHHDDHVRKVERLMELPEGRRRLTRFTPHQRLQHWFLVVMFTTLVVTGFPIKFADDPWSAWVVNKLGGLTAVRLSHRWAGSMLIAGFFYHAIYVLYTVVKARRQTGQSWFRCVWELPMLTRPADMKFMLDLMLYVTFLKKKRPLGDRFNPEEKFEYIGVFWGTFVLGVTGILMWANGWTTRHLPGRFLTVFTLLHTFEAFLAVLHVGIVHMAGVIFQPGVFPMSKAMFTGETPTEELVEAHGAMLHEVEKDLVGALPEEAHHG